MRLIRTILTVTAMLCLLSLLLSASADNSRTPGVVKAPLSKQTYTIPIVGVEDFQTLDPALATDPASISAIQMLYTGLVSVNDQLQIVPQIAISWQVNNNGTAWTFHLRPHLKFSDGHRLTAEDVAYSLDRALQPATKSTVAPLYLGLLKDSDQLINGKINTLINDSIFTPDPQTVLLITSKPANYFLSMLSMPCASVVEKSLITAHGANFTDYLSEGGSSGPFKVAHYTHRSNIVFVPNTQYYNKQPQLQKVTFTFYHTPQQAYQDYQQKLLDTAPAPLSEFESGTPKRGLPSGQTVVDQLLRHELPDQTLR